MTAPFNWDRYEEVPEQAPSNETQGFNWNKFETVPEKKTENLPQKVGRGLDRATARITETLAGIPADIVNLSMLPAKGIQKGVEAITGEDLSEIDVSKLMDRAFPLKGLPTSQRMREAGKGLTGGKYEPKNAAEELGDEIVTDLTSLSVGGGRSSFLKKLGVSIGANLSKEGVKLLGGSEGSQQLAKIGTMVGLSLVNPKGASKYASKLYAEAKQSLPKGASISSANLEEELGSLKAALEKGGSAPSKTKAIEKINEIGKKIEGDQIQIDELVEFKKTINELRQGLYQEFQGNKPGRLLAKKNLDSVSKGVDNAISEYGKTNPEWEKLYRSANEVYGTVAQSKKVSDWIGRTFIPNQITKGAASIGGLAATLFKPIVVPAALAGYAGLKGAELLVRIAKSPTLRKYYAESLKAAVRQDSSAVASNLKKLDAAMTKESVSSAASQ
jgi:hypothetical protein